MGQELYKHVMERLEKYNAVGDFSIRINGCPNSCAQHFTADIGLQGSERVFEGSKRPHYMVYLGGDLQNDVRLAEREKERILHERVPEVVDLILEKFVSERQPGEKFKHYIERSNKRLEVREILQKHGTPQPKEPEPVEA
jgi:sulfite reductase beta subunit-like hemoprotein